MNDITEYALVPSVYVLLQREQQFLLLKRQNTGYGDGQYCTVAGRVEPGETFIQAAVREAKEEVGIVIKPPDLKLCHTMQRKSFDSERIDLFFTAHCWQGEVVNQEPDKAEYIAWYLFSDIMQIEIMPFIKQAFQYLHSGKVYSEFDYTN